MNATASKSAAPASGITRLIAGVMVATVLVALALAASPFDLASALRVHPRLKLPEFALIARQSWILKLHLGAALSALAIGLVIMARPKGVGLHKTLGWLWVGAMAVTAVSSFFLRGLNGGALSLIHLLSGWTVIVLPMGVAAIRSRNVVTHRRIMTNLYVGGLLIAGALTFIPGRLMWAVFFR